MGTASDGHVLTECNCHSDEEAPQLIHCSAVPARLAAVPGGGGQRGASHACVALNELMIATGGLFLPDSPLPRVTEGTCAPVCTMCVVLKSRPLCCGLVARGGGPEVAELA